MSFLMDMFLFPVRLLMKILWILMPLVLLVLALILLVRFPYILLGFTIGFLVSPRVLRRLEIYHIDSNNALEVFSFKNRELQQISMMHQNELKKASDKQKQREKRLYRKIQRLKEEDSLLEKRYTELLDRKPDKVLYIRPRSVFQWMKTRFLTRDK